MKKRWLSFLLCGVMLCSLLSPATSYADGADIGEWEPDIEEGVEDWEDEDTTCKEHDWGEWTIVTEPTCTETGSEERSCKKCTEKATRTLEANGHSWNTEHTVDTEATCTTDGSKSIHCSVVGCLETKDSKVIAKLGHDFKNYESNDDASCTADGTKTAKCERCKVTDTVADTGSKKAHSYASVWSMDDKSHWHACSVCGDKTDVTAHSYDGDICSVCGYERAHIHNVTLVKAVDATCTVGGSKAYYTCSGCDSIFEDAEGKHVINDSNTLIIEALGHEFKDYKANGDATCTQDGTKTSKCSRCDVTNTISDEGSAKGHVMTKVAAVSPTCEKDGNAEYYICSVCDSWFEDVAGKKAISDKNAVVLKANGHAYATSWSKDGDKHWHECTACGNKSDVAAHSYSEDSCSVCGYKKSHVHDLTLVKAVDATCTADGSKAYYMCSGCDSIFGDAEGKNVISDRSTLVVAALGHEFKNYSSNGDATCTIDGTKTAKCEHCNVTDTVKDEKSAKGHKASNTWSKDDTQHWHVCGNCDVKMDQASHTFINDTCSACGYERAHVHNLTLVKAVDATCEKDGNIAYYKCHGCDSIFEDADGKNAISDKNSLRVKALGHSFTKYESNGDATCESDGTKTAKCDRCTKKDTVKDAGSAKGHTYAAIWSKDGETHWHECSACRTKKDVATHSYDADKCTVCGYEKAHVHVLTLVEASEATCIKNGNSAYYTCSGCDGWFADAEGTTIIANKKDVVIGALGHSYDEEGVCTRCDYKNPEMPERSDSEIVFLKTKSTVDFTGSAVELTEDVVEVAKGNGKVTFTYYVDEACSVPTYEDDVESIGDAPTEAGRYYVKATISATYTHRSDTTDDTFVLTIRPRKVTGAKVVNNKSTIKLSWKKCEEADGYIIYRRKKGTATSAYKAIKTIKNNSVLSYSDSNIKQGSAYIYTIRAYADAENGTRIRGLMMTSAVKIVRTKVTSITNQNGSVKIKWTKVNGVAGYKVYRKSSGEATYKRIQTIKNGNTNYYVDKSSKAIKNGKASYYYIKPYYVVDTKEVLTTDKKTNYYVSRAAITSVAGAKKAFTVKWKKNSSATGYQICYSTSKDFASSKKITVSSKSTLSKKIKGLKAGKKYYVKVRSYKKYKDVKYYSAWSAVKNVKTK